MIYLGTYTQSPFDSHVWFDSCTNSVWRHLIDRNSINTKECLLNLLDNATPWFAQIDNFKRKNLATSKLKRIFYNFFNVNKNPSEIVDLNYIFKFLSNNTVYYEKLNLPSTIPPSDVHRMQHSPYWCGDFYTSDLVLDLLNFSNIPLFPNQSILDLGCSSGSLLRILNWFYPEICWKGCDPVETSITWATNNLDDIEFFKSEQEPPIQMVDSSFDGIISISVWSHHNKQASKLWFKEVHRLLKKGGWFLFTTHGLHSLVHNIRNLDKGKERWISIYEGLLQSDFVFEQVWMEEDESGNLADNWGNSYVKPEWIFSELMQDFELISFKRGLNQQNQDVYLFKKK